MNLIIEKIKQDRALQQVELLARGKQDSLYAYGLAGTQKHTVATLGINVAKGPTIILCPHKEAVEEWYSDLMALSDLPIYPLPELDFWAVGNSVGTMALRSKRMEILARLYQGEQCIVLATGESLLNKEINPAEFGNLSVLLKVDAQMEMQDLLYSLANLGYEQVGKVDQMGQYSRRGGLVDIFPVASEEPIRIEFFDNEIESIRAFDLVTQRSEKILKKIMITPMLKPRSQEAKAMVVDYLPKDSLVIVDEPLHLRESIEKVVRENPELKPKVFSWEEVLKQVKSHNVLYLSLMQQRLVNIPQEKCLSVVVKQTVPFQRQMNLLNQELRNWVNQEQQVIIVLSNEEKLRYLKGYLQEANFQVTTDRNNLSPKGGIYLTIGLLQNGFELPQGKLVVITEKDILGRQKKKVRHKTPKENKIQHFRDIKLGDYVVHVNYGIAKYMGIETITVEGIHRDYLYLKFAGTDKLYLPTDKLSLLQKYIGNEDHVPKLSKLNSLAWKKATAKAKKAVEDIAKELIKLYAQRKKVAGFAFSEDTPWQKEFEDAFPYEETLDQLRCIKEIKKDMEASVPMERLLCGDVGFGKTEVAMRAAFKAVMDGKQVAVLVPTTVLVQQHYQTFKQRFEGFGPNLALLCRFNTPKEQKAIFKDLEEGKTDIIIGTHALLNTKKVKFKDLGLLIVDEEQRFGVKQKEKIKTLAQNIDVLALSATPIPRTLHMSLAGARDMSVIETPPHERLPVQTYVIENNDLVVADAIKRELRRGGQVYFIYNRVETMDQMYLKLSAMLPEASIAMAHGRMSEDELEGAMVEFYEGKKDILLATSIVENGLDVPKANTIIIYDADYFGLSQLYQMRGRVGRSKEMAFAYFVYQRDKVLSEVAEKRLQAIKEFAELGAGFKIAMRDLEIRGAGDILGSQQHGHIASVGFEMYCQLLEEAMETLQNGGVPRQRVDTNVELKVDAYIDGDYISDATVKVEVYQRIAGMRKLQQLANFKEELQDRFGEFTKPVMTLLQVAELRIYGSELGMALIKQKGSTLTMDFQDVEALDVDNVVNLQRYYGNRLKVLDKEQRLQLTLDRELQGKVLEVALNAVKILHGE